MCGKWVLFSHFLHFPQGRTGARWGGSVWLQVPGGQEGPSSGRSPARMNEYERKMTADRVLLHQWSSRMLSWDDIMCIINLEWEAILLLINFVSLPLCPGAVCYSPFIVCGPVTPSNWPHCCPCRWRRRCRPRWSTSGRSRWSVVPSLWQGCGPTLSGRTRQSNCTAWWLGTPRPVWDGNVYTVYIPLCILSAIMFAVSICVNNR